MNHGGNPASGRCGRPPTLLPGTYSLFPIDDASLGGANRGEGQRGRASRRIYLMLPSTPRVKTPVRGNHTDLLTELERRTFAVGELPLRSPATRKQLKGAGAASSSANHSGESPV